ncbi:14907_t:CDS:1, partial [Funneliformis mosseae]
YFTVSTRGLRFHRAAGNILVLRRDSYGLTAMHMFVVFVVVHFVAAA